MKIVFCGKKTSFENTRKSGSNCVFFTDFLYVHVSCVRNVRLMYDLVCFGHGVGCPHMQSTFKCNAGSHMHSCRHAIGTFVVRAVCGTYKAYVGCTSYTFCKFVTIGTLFGVLFISTCDFSMSFHFFP